MKNLIVYYSFDGNTRLVAQAMAEATGADMLELKALGQPKHRGFLKYFWGGRQVMMKEKPALLPLDKNLQDYDLLLIGTPVWAFSYAPALATFFLQSKLSGKNSLVLLFRRRQGQDA